MASRKNGGCATWASLEPRTSCTSPGPGRGGGVGSFGREWHHPSSVPSLQESLRSGGPRHCGHLTGGRADGRTGGQVLIGDPADAVRLGHTQTARLSDRPTVLPKRPLRTLPDTSRVSASNTVGLGAAPFAD